MNSKLFVSLLTTTSLAFGQAVEKPEGFVELEPLFIQSSPLAPQVDELTQGWSLLEGRELDRIKAPTIGETLAFEPGVTQSFYGPHANRPIVRGLDGQRIRILQNGLELFDVSALSVDHAVGVDPLLVERVEILRGSSALLYGANAIGGVVNTLDQTIPTMPIEGQVEGEIRTSYTSVNDGWSTGAAVVAGDDRWLVQANGVFRQTNDYDVSTFTLPDGTRTDTVENSDSETWTAGLGGSYLFDNGYAGVAFSQMDSRYGVPNEEAPTLDSERQRFEFRGAWAPVDSDWIEQFEVQMTYGDYRHDEIETSGEIAATFEREGFENRVTLVHAQNNWEGVLGFQGNFEKSSVSGEENFFVGASGRNPVITGDDSQRYAFFAKESYQHSETLSMNGGVRLEYWERQLSGAGDRDDFSISASGGVVWKLNEGWLLSGNVNYTERQPETSELFSDGPHLATEAFEVGDPSLDEESAVGVEVILRRNEGPVTGQFTGFYTTFDNFIFLDDTGNVLNPEGMVPGPGDEALAERIHRGVSAEFYGFEGEVNWEIVQSNQWLVNFRGFGDVLWSENTTDGTNLPRTSPWRLGAGFDIGFQDLFFSLDLTHTGRQDDTAPGESETGSYTLLDLYASYTLERGRVESEFYIKGSNITDDVAFIHTSFIRDTAPLPGASVEVGMNVKF